ncbi:MAG: hypothetical protein JEY91_16310, partial [Spirochaetaceae bacterium]|nr:hypothetical protein [Spirochaetaceae bacterium]
MTSGIISLNASRQGRNVVIEITDDGVGMNEIWKSHDESGSNGVGMSNVHRRLELIYGKPYGLNVKSTAGEGTMIQILIPSDPEEEYEETIHKGTNIWKAINMEN